MFSVALSVYHLFLKALVRRLFGDIKLCSRASQRVCMGFTDNLTNGQKNY